MNSFFYIHVCEWNEYDARSPSRRSLFMNRMHSRVQSSKKLFKKPTLSFVCTHSNFRARRAFFFTPDPRRHVNDIIQGVCVVVSGLRNNVVHASRECNQRGKNRWIGPGRIPTYFITIWVPHTFNDKTS